MSRYDVFLSYSHEDSVLADRISRRIRSYRAPKSVRLGKRRLDVFRDVERLTASPDLSQELRERVGTSEHLVLLASPASATSEYVEQEVRAFLEDKGETKVLVVLARGELTESLPPSLSQKDAAPLFIDLRNAGRKQFRLETLRLIAGLFGVDYSELRREDDERRRHRRNGTIVTAFLAALILASAYLISTTPAEVWLQEPQPVRVGNVDPLLPVEKFAVRQNDPSVVIWLGYNARYARDLGNAKTRVLPSKDLWDFTRRAEQYLKGLTDLQKAAAPLATVKIEALDGDNVIGSGELQVHGVLEDGKVRFFSSFGFVGDTESGKKQIVVPLTAVESDRSPFDLEPWLVGPMREAGFEKYGLTLRGCIEDRTTDEEPDDVRFYEYDDTDEIREVLYATASDEYEVLTNSSEWQPRLEEELEAAGGEDFWRSIDNSPEWATYKAHERQELKTFDRSDPSEMIASARKRGVEEFLARALAREIDQGDVHTVYEFSRRVGARRISVAVVNSYWDHHESVKDPAPIHFCQSGSDARWVRVNLPLEGESTRIVDVFPLDATGMRVLILTDREGFFRTTNGGNTWHNVNFNESRLRNGEKVRTVTVGAEVYALAVLHTQPGEDVNPLFRLKRRNWIERWRAGLVRLLSE